jgi:hypothetical protein
LDDVLKEERVALSDSPSIVNTFSSNNPLAPSDNPPALPPMVEMLEDRLTCGSLHEDAYATMSRVPVNTLESVVFKREGTPRSHGGR